MAVHCGLRFTASGSASSHAISIPTFASGRGLSGAVLLQELGDAGLLGFLVGYAKIDSLQHLRQISRSTHILRGPAVEEALGILAMLRITVVPGDEGQEGAGVGGELRDNQCIPVLLERSRRPDPASSAIGKRQRGCSGTARLSNSSVSTMGKAILSMAGSRNEAQADRARSRESLRPSLLRRCSHAIEEIAISVAAQRPSSTVPTMSAWTAL